MACLTASIRIRQPAMAGEMWNVGLKLVRFFVVINATFSTGRRRYVAIIMLLLY